MQEVQLFIKDINNDYKRVDLFSDETISNSITPQAGDQFNTNNSFNVNKKTLLRYLQTYLNKDIYTTSKCRSK